MSPTHRHHGQEPVQAGGRGIEHTHLSRTASRRALLIALAIIGTLFFIEGAGGLVTNSLALLADAGHLLTDIGAIFLALGAMWFASRPISWARSFGYYRLEVLAALANGLTLWAIAGYIGYEAYLRLLDPPEVESALLLAVASVGFVAQVATALILHRTHGESLNVKAAYIHVMTDAVQSMGVIAAGVVMLAFGWFLADPIISLLIALLITWSGGRVVWEATGVLLESSPRHIDMDALCRRLERVQYVTGVHDIHAWSITTGYDVLSAHVTANMATLSDPNDLLQNLRDIASREFGIAHVTIQLEDSPDGCREDHHIAHEEVVRR